MKKKKRRKMNVENSHGIHYLQFYQLIILDI